ncbi:hypothetical protein E4T47_08901 [Aureobasidium subglaciale]|nr:hypothetical protein E4T47_08901 [Aureobasidium subglaciale]
MDLSNLGISQLQVAYSTGRIRPANVVRQVYQSIAEHPDKAVWIHLLPESECLARAQALTGRHDPDSLPPLFGVPFSVKDSIDVAGLPTTLACPSFAYIAERTAPVVLKLLQAGAILIGKTNLDQFATGLAGVRSPYGVPRCALDADYISGGSSSGSAISVAASLVSFTVCTDTGGSTRVPAALNGLVGLKPTLGTVSTTGLFPACKNIDCVCIMARTVDDAKTLYDIVQGYDSSDAFSRRELPTWAPWSDSVRFAIPDDEDLQSLSPTYAGLFDDAVANIQQRPDFVKTNFDYSIFRKANQMLYDSSIVAQRLLAFQPYIRSEGLEKLHPAIKVTFESAAANAFDATRAYEDIFTLAHYKRLAEEEFKKIDIIIVPSTVCHWTMAELEEEPMERNKVMGQFTNFVNLLDLCAISIPAGTWKSCNGKLMSFGVTVIGQAGKDNEIMEVGRKLMY